MPSLPKPDETGPQLARRAREAGAFVGIAHPAASLFSVRRPTARGCRSGPARSTPSSCRPPSKAGHYCSSTGPQIHDVGVEDGMVSVRCSPATKILVSGGAPAGQVRTRPALTEATLPMGDLADALYGRRAWTNPTWSSGTQEPER